MSTGERRRRAVTGAMDRGGETAKPRGRPIAFDRETAIRAAMDRFWADGFEAVSVIDLADAMAIRRSSFYNSFGSREAVFREALDTYRRQAPDAALGAVKPGDAVGPVLRRIARELCRVRAADPAGRGCLVINSIAELVGGHPQLGPVIEQAVADSLSVYERLIEQAVAQKEIAAPADTRVMAQAFLTFSIGLNTISKVIRDEAALWRLCENFLAAQGF